MFDLNLILPIRGLGISRLSDEPGHLILPLANNTNDKATIFAGSIFSLAAVSGYDIVFEKQKTLFLSGQLFLLSSQIVYHQPALFDLVAKSRIVEDFVQTKSGNFKMPVKVEVFDSNNNDLCATFEGTYVVKTNNPA
jgi:thioesterase domain-containing protein